MEDKYRSMTQTDYDVVILGGGLNGLAAALALADSGLSLCLAEYHDLSYQETPLPPYDSRVCALTEASYRFLDNLGVWDETDISRVCEFDQVEVWDAEGTGRISFYAREVGYLQLGRIAENSVMIAGMLRKLKTTPVVRIDNTEVKGMEQTSSHVSLLLANGKTITTRLLIAADGATSKIRQWTSIPLIQRDCLHHAIVCTVKTDVSHQHCARQVFLESGPLAFLPLPSITDNDGQMAHYHSVVWSSKPARAREILAMDDKAFCHAITQAGESCVGEIVESSKRTCIPLSQRHTTSYVKGRVVLVGDAAHTVHPLAGQGVNLGFLDVGVLAEEILKACQRGDDHGNLQILKRYQRRRQGHNLTIQGAMEFFQHIYNQNALPLRWLRNAGMQLVDRQAIIKRYLIRQVMGITGDIPVMMQATE